MAAKALSSLVPLQKVPQDVSTILEQLISSFAQTSKAAPVERLSSNLLHGMLLQVCDLVSNLNWYMTGDSANMGTNEVYSSPLLTSVSLTHDSSSTPQLFPNSTSSLFQS
jgi:hypothetical protein